MGENFGPSYFAIITGPLLDNRALAANAKLLYASITSLTDSRGYCWASNKYLADRFGWGERTVTRLVAQLQEQLSPAGAQVQQPYSRPEEFPDPSRIIPGQRVHLVAAVQVGEVPPGHAPGSLFPPLGKQCFPVHVFLSTWWNVFRFPCFW